MPTGDPMWKCQYCGATHYLANRASGFCDCPNAKAEFGHHEQFLGLPPHDTVALKEEPKETVTAKAHKDTLVVNLFAGPGAGKSTTAAGVFFELKTRGVNCELAAEYAKDLVWEERHATFRDQIYLFAKQYHRIFRLLGQVDVIVTDCPILLSPVYDYERRETFEKLVVEEHNKMWTYNTFIKRKKAFNPKGRIHDLEQSQALDCAIADMLYKHGVAFETFEGTPAGRDAIVNKVLLMLQWKQNQ